MRYTKLTQDYWTNRNSRAIVKTGDQGLQVFLYLESGPMSTYTGLYYLDLFQAVGHLAISEAVLLEYIQKFEQLGLLKYDSQNDVIWMINSAEKNVGELKAPAGGKPDLKVVCVRKEFNCVAKASPLRHEFYEKYAAMLKLLPMETAPASQAPVSRIQPDLTESMQASESVDAAVPPVDTAPIDLGAKGIDFYRAAGVIDVLMQFRQMNRDLCVEGGDFFVQAQARKLFQRLGHEDAKNLIVAALLSGDFDLQNAKENPSSKAIADLAAEE